MQSEMTLKRNDEMHTALAGRMLISARQARNLSARNVEAMTLSIAESLGSEFAIPAGCLTDIESGLLTPTVFGMASLCAVYELDMPQVLTWYGIRMPKPERSVVPEPTMLPVRSWMAPAKKGGPRVPSDACLLTLPN